MNKGLRLSLKLAMMILCIMVISNITGRVGWADFPEPPPPSGDSGPSLPGGGTLPDAGTPPPDTGYLPPTGTFILTAGSQAELPPTFQGTVTLDGGTLYGPGQTYYVEGEGMLNQGAFTVEQATFFIPAGQVELLSAEQVKIEGNTLSGICKDSCLIGDISVAKGTTFSYTIGEQRLEGTCSIFCSVDSISLPEALQFQYEMTADGTRELSFPQGAKESISLDTLDRDNWNNLPFVLDIIPPAGGKVVSLGKEGDSFSSPAGTAGRVRIISSPEGIPEVIIDPGILYATSSGLEFFSVDEATTFCRRSCERGEGNWIMEDYSAHRLAIAGAGETGVEVRFTSFDWVPDFQKGDFFSVQVYHGGEVELFNRKSFTTIPEDIEIAGGVRERPLVLLGIVAHPPLESSGETAGETAGKTAKEQDFLTIENGAGTQIRAQGNDLYGDVYRILEDTPLLFNENIIPYELVIVDEQYTPTVKMFQTADGGVRIDDRSLLTDLIVPIQPQLLQRGFNGDFSGSRPFLGYRAAKELQAACTAFVDVGGQCQVTDASRTFGDQLGIFEESQRVGIRAANNPYNTVSNHMLMQAVDICVTCMGPPPADFLRAEPRDDTMRRWQEKVRNSHIPFDTAYRQTLPPLGTLGRTGYNKFVQDLVKVNIQPGSPRYTAAVRSFQQQRMVNDYYLSIFRPIAKKQGFDPIPTEDWHFEYTPPEDKTWMQFNQQYGQKQGTQFFQQQQRERLESITPLQGKPIEVFSEEQLSDAEGTIIT